MSKEDDLLLEWGRRRQEIQKFIEKFMPTSRWHNDEKVDFFKLIMEYGDAQAALATERCKEWMRKKLK